MLARPASAEEALQRLRDGNRRYAESQTSRPHQSRQRREEVASGQHPWAIVWGCIDSRVAPELLFDVGLGDLFVIRTAGQAIDRVSLGSAEFGAEEFEVPLLVVLGHERCGAVTAAIEVIAHNSPTPGEIGSIVEAIRPAIESTSGRDGDKVDNAVRANVDLQVRQLKNSSVLGPLATQGKLRVIGARYDLESGRVEFFES